MRKTRREGQTGRSASCAVACILLATSLAMAPTSPAVARHGNRWVDADTCAGAATPPGYRTESKFHSHERALVAYILLGAEGAYEIADRADAKVPGAIAKGVLAAVLTAAQVAELVVTGTNRIAQACYEPRHLKLEDELMKMTIQANLAVTTSPDVSFLLPEELPTAHIPPIREHRPGFIDREREGVEPPDIVGVKATVRATIDSMIELNQCTCSAANSYYDQAVTALGNGQLKTAYRLFRQAYVYAFSN